jgi:hypothetical protein
MDVFNNPNLGCCIRARVIRLGLSSNFKEWSFFVYVFCDWMDAGALGGLLSFEARGGREGKGKGVSAVLLCPVKAAAQTLHSLFSLLLFFSTNSTYLATKSRPVYERLVVNAPYDGDLNQK